MTVEDLDSTLNKSAQAAIADAARAFAKTAKNTPKMSYHELSDAEYTRQRDQVIVKREGVSETPYADSNGIVSIGIGVNMRVERNFTGILNDFGLLPEGGISAAQPGKLNQEQIGELEAIAQKKFPPTPLRSLAHNPVQKAFDAKMAEFHKEDQQIPARFAYPSDVPVLARIKSALSDFEKNDQSPRGSNLPAVESADAKALHLDTLTLGQRDQLREIVNTPGSNTSHIMVNLNAKMAVFHSENAEIPESIPGSSVAKMKAMTDGLIAENYEKVVDKWVPGMPPSSERAALVSMAYNGLIKTHGDESLHQAVISGNHAEAATQIAFLHNGGKKPQAGIADRRLDEGDLMGTTPPSGIYGPVIPSLRTDFQISNAKDLHADAIDRNLARWGSDDTTRGEVYSQRVDNTYVQPASNAYANIIEKEKEIAASGVHTDTGLREILTTPNYNGESQFSAIRFDMMNCLGVKFSDEGHSDPTKLNSPATAVQSDAAAIASPGRNGR